MQPQLEMQVRARAPARAARDRDRHPDIDFLPSSDTCARKVRVERRIAAADVDLDHVAVALVAALRSDANDLPGRRRANLERTQDADVDARVMPAAVVPVRRRDRPLRRPQERGRCRTLSRDHWRGRDREGDEQGQHGAAA
jgi:hypothetical protein